MKKIIVCGFPHCGTTILKSIIGHIPKVEETPGEKYFLEEKDRKTDKEYLLCKTPYANQSIFSKTYDSYIKIFIIRNPKWVFSSLNRRFSYKLPFDHTIIIYIKICKLFLMQLKKKTPGVYCIKYEDLFEDNHIHVKKIFDDIGFEYKDEIFQNDLYVNMSNQVNYNPDNFITDKPVDETQHSIYRTWQINQPFVNNNDESKIQLTDQQIKIIKENKWIQKLYPGF